VAPSVAASRFLAGRFRKNRGWNGWSHRTALMGLWPPLTKPAQARSP
jgi:hypothetical protein